MYIIVVFVNLTGDVKTGFYLSKKKTLCKVGKLGTTARISQLDINSTKYTTLLLYFY